MKYILLTLTLLLSVKVNAGKVENLEKLFDKDYDFSVNVFSSRVKDFENHLAHLKGKVDLKYLEVGVLEGASMVWMLTNILSHKSSEAVAVDVFWHEKTLKKFKKNLKIGGFTDQVKIMKDFSKNALRKLHKQEFDVIYIDGSHVGKDVLMDIVLAWPLLKEGGVMILDDYLSPAPTIISPKAAIDSFSFLFRNEIEVLHQKYIAVFKKKADPCEKTTFMQECVLAKGRTVHFFNGEHFDLSGKKTGQLKGWDHDAFKAKIFNMSPTQSLQWDEKFFW